MLYNGCRSGEVFSIDVRLRSHKGHGWKAIRLFHHSAVTSVNLLKDENYLMAADMDGQVEPGVFPVHMFHVALLFYSHMPRFLKIPLNVRICCNIHLQIKLWDLRKHKCVKEYGGHHNEHALLPLHISEEEGLLTAGTTNCCM